MISKQIFKGASILSLSQIVVAICTFARNVLVARLVSVEDYGIATTFAVTLAMIEMTSNLAFEKILVQDERGGDDDMLASAHFLHFVKSFATGLILLVVGPLMASLFDLENITWAFQLLALIPILRGLTHFDTVTYQRDMRFAPMAMVDSLSQVLVLLVVYPLGMWLGDYRVMLGLVLVQPFIYMVLTHLYAKRPYRWAIHKSLIQKKVRFGWPLLINGLLMFAIFNGDKAIIGHSYSMETLGWYGAAFALTLMPTLLFAKICTTLLLPLLSGQRSSSLSGDTEQYIQTAILATTCCFAVAIFCYLFFVLAGSAVINLFYGERYIEGARVVSLLALMQALRIARTAPTIVAISYSDTKNAMFANIARVAILPLALLFAYLAFDVEWLVYVSVAGEVFALIISVYLLRLGDNKKPYVKSVLKYSAAFGVLSVAGYFIAPLLNQVHGSVGQLFAVVSVAVILSSLAGVALVFVESRARSLMFNALNKRKSML